VPPLDGASGPAFACAGCASQAAQAAGGTFAAHAAACDQHALVVPRRQASAAALCCVYAALVVDFVLVAMPSSACGGACAGWQNALVASRPPFASALDRPARFLAGVASAGSRAAWP